MESAQQHWKVIYTASRQEKKVAEMLSKYGIEHYLPMVKKLRVWSDRKKWVESPIFNSYVFVKPNLQQRDEILHLTGVVKYLRHNGVDSTVSDKEIQKIKFLLEKGYELSLYKEEIVLIGDIIEVISGPMKGYTGDVAQLKGEFYAVILLANMGQSIKIKLPKQVLRRIER
jgi:transcription antitermination factor NusG